MVRKQVKRRTSLLMGISLALLIGAAAAFFVFALPQNLLEKITVLTGLSRLMVQAEPPISPNDRILLAVLAGIGTTGVGWVLIDWLIFGRAGMSALIRPREDEFEDDDGYRPSDPLDLVTPMPRPVDLPMPVAPSADPRRPLSARTDIGDPPLPLVFAPPPLTEGVRPDGQALPPLDRLFADAARAPAPAAPSVAPVPDIAISPSLGSPRLDPASLFSGLTSGEAPQARPGPTPIAAVPPQPDPWPAVSPHAPAWPPIVDRPRPTVASQEPAIIDPPITLGDPPALAPSGLSRSRADRMVPDFGMASFPPNLPDLADSPYFTPSPPPSAIPTSFLPIAESEIAPPASRVEPEPEPIRVSVDKVTPPIVALVQEPPSAEMPLEDMLARLESGMEKRRRALAITAPPEPPIAPQRRPLPAYAAAPVREAPVPIMAVVPSPVQAPAPWTPPVSPEPSSPNSDGLLDQPLQVALGVLRNLVRG